jgi:hypothetical protein
MESHDLITRKNYELDTVVMVGMGTSDHSLDALVSIQKSTPDEDDVKSVRTGTKRSEKPVYSAIRAGPGVIHPKTA